MKDRNSVLLGFQLTGAFQHGALEPDIGVTIRGVMLLILRKSTQHIQYFYQPPKNGSSA